MIKKYHVSKNLLSISDCNFTINSTLSVTFSKGTISFSGSSGYISSSNAAWKTNFAFYLDAGTYSMNIPSQLGAGYARYIKQYSDDTTLLGASATSFTLAERTQVYFAFYIDGKTLNDTMDFMLASGSTVLPYEPYDSEVWHTVGYKKYGTETETFTTLPHEVIGDGQSNLTWSMDGNMQVSGTPTPQNPITPAETGEKTANLFDKDNTAIQNAYLYDTGSSFLWATASDSRSVAIRCQTSTQYTLSISSSIPIFRIALTNDNAPTPTQSGFTCTKVVNGSNISQYTFTTGSDTTYIIFQGTGSMVDTWFNSLMLVAGSTALPYEPFGYKIPISFNGVTYPIYLSEPIRKINDSVDTAPSTGTATRYIYKHELTGQETWSRTSIGKMYSSNALNGLPNYNHALAITTMCSHYKSIANAGNTGTLSVNEICFFGNPNATSIREVYIYPENYATAEDYATYLQQQYANGTPVTIWFIMETPTTETFTAPTIPTTGTAESFDVSTTLKPSEVSLTYHGWHEHTDTKYTSG